GNALRCPHQAVLQKPCLDPFDLGIGRQLQTAFKAAEILERYGKLADVPLFLPRYDDNSRPARSLARSNVETEIALELALGFAASPGSQHAVTVMARLAHGFHAQASNAQRFRATATLGQALEHREAFLKSGVLFLPRLDLTSQLLNRRFIDLLAVL